MNVAGQEHTNARAITLPFTHPSHSNCMHTVTHTHTHQVVAVLLDSFNNAWCARARVRVRALNT